MSVSIEWLLNYDYQEGFHLIAGDLTHPVNIKNINVIDNPDTVPWLTEGTLVLSTGYLFSDTSLTQDLIKDLAHKKCSGLGIKMNRYLTKLPDSMIEQANEYHFPIFDIPFSSNMGNIANLIYNQIYASEMNETARLSVLYKKITECILQKQSLSKLLPIICQATHEDIFLTNGSFDIIGYSLESSSSRADSHSLFSDSDISYILHHYDTSVPIFFYETKSDEITTHYKFIPLSNKNTLLGFLIASSPCILSIENQNFLTMIGSALSLVLMNDTSFNDSERSHRYAFFQKLLSGELHSLQQMESACHQNQFDFTKDRIAFVLNIPEYEMFTIAKRRAYEKKIFAIFDELLPEYANQMVKTVFQAQFVLYYFTTSTLSQHHAAILGADICKKLLSTLNQHQIASTIGYSKLYCGANSIRTGYQEALAALEIGQKLHPQDVSFSYWKDQTYHDLLRHFTHNELQELYQETLGILEENDRDSQSELLHTLYAYLQCQENVSKTAKELFIHRNTMFYRLDQIRELIQVDLSDQNDIYRLRTAFYIRTILTVLS